MALIRWNPGTDIFNLHSELDRVFNEMSEVMPPPQNGGRPAFLPLDVKKADNGLEIAASLPGLQPENVSVTVENGILTIDARQEQEVDKRDSEFLRRERYTGRMFRQVHLGEQVDGDAAKAYFQDGVLTVTVPLSRRPAPKKIPVSTTASGSTAK